MFDFDIVSFIPRAVMQGIPLLYGSTGEILTEKSGNLNLGIPGIMYVGGICGVIGAFFYEQAVPADQMSGFLAIMIPMLCSLLGSLLMGLLYCFLTDHDHLRRGHRQLLRRLPDQAHRQRGALHCPVRHQRLFCQVPALRQEPGLVRPDLPVLWLPGVPGHYPGSADVLFPEAHPARSAPAVRGSNNAFGDRGWLAIALVIFTIWRPNVSVLASILFGGLYILYLYIPTGTQMAVKELYKMLPYVVTVVVLVISSLRNNKEKQPPASLGLSYFREER